MKGKLPESAHTDHEREVQDLQQPCLCLIWTFLSKKKKRNHKNKQNPWKCQRKGKIKAGGASVKGSTQDLAIFVTRKEK